MVNTVSILVVGKSGAGKSEFIGSFANNQDDIKASGEGQTTRTNVEYLFSINEPTPKIEVKYLNEDQFVNKRLSQIGEIKIPKDTFDYSILEQVLVIDGFFNYKEFDFEEQPTSHLIENLWENILNTLSLEEKFLKEEYSHEEYNSVKSLIQDNLVSNEEKEKLSSFDESTYSLQDIIELFLRATFKLCKAAIKDFPTTFFLNELNIEDKQRLTYALKVINGKSSTGLIDKVIIHDQVKRKYEDIMYNLDINTLIFIDTYGLDHSEQLQNDTLNKRYTDLFNQYPDINTIFFIRALNSDAPSDLKLAIPAIYNSKPSAVPYLIFTKVDRNDSIQKEANKSIIDLLEINQQTQLKAVQYFNESKNEKELKSKLRDEGVPISLINSRYDVLKNNLTPYCSKDIEEYQENNAYQIEKVLKSIVNKEHLGSSLVNINDLLNIVNNNHTESKKHIQSLLKMMFEFASKDWSESRFQSRTIWKNRESLENGFLGYDGTYLDSWHIRFLFSYYRTFSKISKEKFEQLFKLDWESNEAIAIQETLNGFSYRFIKFRDVNILNADNLTPLMKYIVYNNPNFNNIYGFKCTTKPIYQWLTKVYDFKKYYTDVQEGVYELFAEDFNTHFIYSCREHNQRVLKKKYTEKHELEQELEVYFKELDSTLDNEQKKIFKNSVLGSPTTIR
ncbi:hypothetical protein ACQKII_24380 [Lysinibacillus sp. NPDC048646]|uniref:hypothetical protein n=1 Tax=Lysinibacillus sp. NPDC048646 TaxID=3390574 RepID=UPI003D03992E